MARSGPRYTAELLRQNWRKNYRHRGGVVAMARCLLGHWRLLRQTPPHTTEQETVDCVTCSVIPHLTGLWAKFMHRAVPAGAARIWIGDCSGGFRPEHALGAPVNIFGLLNFEHGRKVDHLLQHACRSEFVIISDDDVFWLDETPWRWARAQFDRDPMTAVVSLMPRERFTWEIDGQKHQPMGSYCLVIRREIWLKEGISLKGVALPSPNTQSYQGYYDTGDYANVELIKRGYRVMVAPAEVRSHLAIFKNISSSLLNVQKDPPQKERVRRNATMLVTACCLARGLSALIEGLNPAGGAVDVVPPELLAKAEADLRNRVDETHIAEIQREVETLLRAMRASLAGEGLWALEQQAPPAASGSPGSR